MKKVFLIFVVIGFLFGGMFQQVHAQDKKNEFNLNASALTNNYFQGVAFTIGAGLDFHLGKRIMISPEVQVHGNPFTLSIASLTTGAIVNFKLKNFFVGGGVILPTVSDDGLMFLDLFPKFNVGIRLKRIKLSLYMITLFDFFLEEFILGGSIGYVF
jgi:hypothetical protein